MKYFFLPLSAVLLFMACSKSTTPTLTRADKLRNSRWTLASGTVTVKLPSGKKDTTLNYLDFIPKCHKGDYLTFGQSFYGAVHNGSHCTLADPDSVTFQWGLSGNDNFLSISRGFSLIWEVLETVLPYNVDTNFHEPFLELDTLHGVNDTLPGYTRTIIVLDSFWSLRFDSLHVPNFDIDKATFSSFTDNSFTINFKMFSTYPDTNNFRTGSPPAPNLPPLQLPDTLKYTVTYNKQ